MTEQAQDEVMVAICEEYSRIMRGDFYLPTIKQIKRLIDKREQWVLGLIVDIRDLKRLANSIAEADELETVPFPEESGTS